MVFREINIFPISTDLDSTMEWKNGRNNINSHKNDFSSQLKNLK